MKNVYAPLTFFIKKKNLWIFSPHNVFMGAWAAVLTLVRSPTTSAKGLVAQIKCFLFWKNNWLFNICQSSCFCTLSQIWWSKLSSIYCEDAHQLRITILLFVNHPTRRQTSCCIIFWIFQMLCLSYPCCSAKNLKSVIQTPKVLTKITMSKLRLRFGWLKFLLSRFNKVLFPITLNSIQAKDSHIIIFNIASNFI